MHAGRGRLDATQEDLGCGWAWSEVHRVRPRVPLACPECGHGVHGKVSSAGMRFFAHDRGSPTCALAQESMEHHLTKLQLAHAVRSAGWYAELEVRAPDGSWRADVMASSADGVRRMAWEAQLSPITRDELRERTTRYAADGVSVCWVTLSSRLWVGAVPSVVASAPRPGSTERWSVGTGVGRFAIVPCRKKCRCPHGHGRWERVNAPLEDFVAWVLGDRIVPHRLLADDDDHRVLWTAPAYIGQAAAFAAVEREHQAKRTSEERRRRQERHAELTAARDWRSVMPMGRRFRLEAAAARWAETDSGRSACLGHEQIADPRWAGGLPVYVSGHPYAILRPAVDRTVWSELAGLVVLTVGDDERRAVVDRAPALTRVVDLSAWLADRPVGSEFRRPTASP
ncbi:competence protein CoiA family protein [Kitasatospora sp. CM 4170]|uniref:Competence protein CoiA n=1 Tax=Kitasatospora aburaviensis TaxID=67265 RepID=A0ABW1F5H4_9ACTN|nr:competence protein CoiA family protein [Kitasatospora sp. CM 4170]WNM49903.1 competence protein CoiA family protein [Kitasatospora sp. CM 4170]